MNQWFFRLCLVGGVIALNGCVIGGPDARRESAWIKPGFDEEMVGSELSHCSRSLTGALGFQGTSEERSHAFDMCMLHKGFRYIDSPRPMTNRGHCQSMGKHANTDNRPSCRSLRGDLKVAPNNPVTPEQAAIRMVEDSPRPNGVPAFTVKCLYSLTCYNALERAEPGRIQKVIDALPDDVRKLLLSGGYWTPAAKNNRSPLAPKQ
jgi:hypothetical protein